MPRIRVEPPGTRDRGYDVIVQAGILDELPSRIAAVAAASKYAVITPDVLAATIGARVLASLHDAGLDAALLTFPDGEPHKTRTTWAALADRMLELGMGRDSCVIALGGGVAGDLAGFVAATFMRGVPFVQLPTTILAMIDASVGGKTGVDTPAGKNLVGAFHSPCLVLADPLVLRTLPAAELCAGLAEAVKHGAILDAQYFEWIGDHADRIIERDAAALEQLIARSVELKAGIVTEDPFESGRRAILNFGHTVGHALERVHEYSIAHGAAVAVGMCVEAALGEAAGITRHGTAAALSALLNRIALPTDTAAPAEALVHAMRTDKKARDARIRFVLLREIGVCAPDARGTWTHAIDIDLLREVLHRTAPPGAV